MPEVRGKPMYLKPFHTFKGPLRGYTFWCPGCRGEHAINTVPGDWPCWGFNGDLQKPSFTPSVLVRRQRAEPPVTSENLDEWKRAPWPQTKVEYVCHLYLTDGVLHFLPDSTHHLSGKSVPLPIHPESD